MISEYNFKQGDPSEQNRIRIIKETLDKDKAELVAMVDALEDFKIITELAKKLGWEKKKLDDAEKTIEDAKKYLFSEINLVEDHGELEKIQKFIMNPSK